MIFRKKTLNKFMISIILLICAYQMDLGKNYETYLDNDEVIQYLKKYNIDDEVIQYIKSNNYSFNGQVIYLRNNADSECMIYYSNNECYLVFIGTQFDMNDKKSLYKDLWTDICLGLGTINFLNKKIKIHSKYVCNMNNQNLLQNIINHIKNLNYKKINICGHSMGSGLGTYTSIVLTKNFPNLNFKLITFDSPKIGNIQLKKYIKKIKNLEHFDIINNKDIIPLFPFIFPNYSHIAKKTFILCDDGNIKVCKKFNKEISIFTNYSISKHFTNSILLNIYKYLIKNS